MPRPRSARKPGPRTAPDAGVATRTIVVLGAGRHAEQVRGMLQRLGLDCRAATEPTRVLQQAAGVALVAIVPPLAGLSAEDFCRRVRERDAVLPLLVVASAPAPEVARLYRAGASGQFDWPAERTAFVRTVLRLAGGGSRPSRSARDVALAARAEERMRNESPTFGPLVQVRVRRGIVFLVGEVDAAWKVSALARLLSALPGVEDVVTSEIRVPVSRIPDGDITRALRGLLQHAAAVDDETLAVRVSKGRVVLSGTARSRRELDRAVELIEQVRGVRGVDSFVVVSRPAKSRDRQGAQRLARLLRSQFPGSRVEVFVFGAIAVLSGVARSVAERRAIGALVAAQPGIDRVVDKIG